MAWILNLENAPLNEAEYKYRPLKKTFRGWDVYGLQNALINGDYLLPVFGADGWFGDETDAAVRQFQKDEINLVVDGIAGSATQSRLVNKLIRAREMMYNVAPKLAKGQIEHESSYWVGNYTAVYPKDGKRDLGLVMVHRTATDGNCFYTFAAYDRIDELAAFLRSQKDVFTTKLRSLEKNNQRYYGPNGADIHERAWKLASGAWNAPSWANDLAFGLQLSPAAHDHFFAYVESTTAYVTTWVP